MKRITYLMFCLLVLLSCSKNDDGDSKAPPPDTTQVPDGTTPDESKQSPNPTPNPSTENQPPGIPDLIFPEMDQLCLGSELIFDWADATDPEENVLTYQLQISTNRAFTDLVEDLTVSDTNVELVMEKGHDYYWRVLAIDENNEKGEFSPSRAFYVEGEASSNHVPFIPALVEPQHNSNVSPQNVVLRWESSDLDDDTLTYDIYLGTTENPELYEVGRWQNNLEVDLEPNQNYYWKVLVSDGSSKSIGKVWVFKTTE